MWMECIRPSFNTLSIFPAHEYHPYQEAKNCFTYCSTSASSRYAMSKLQEIVPLLAVQRGRLNVVLPQEMDLSSASGELIRWVVYGTDRPGTSVFHFLISRELGYLLNQTLGAGYKHQPETFGPPYLQPFELRPEAPGSPAKFRRVSRDRPLRW